MKSFHDFLSLKEATEGKKTSSEYKLEKDSPHKPFIVDAEHNPNLRPIIKAFLDSPNVVLRGVDGEPLTTLDKEGESTPKLKKKTLYLVGGAVRDHMLGKKPKDFDLATDATPPEIRLILKHAGFTETQPQGGKYHQGGQKPAIPEPGSKKRIFYAKGWDKAGREFVIGARVNGEEFEIATFRRDSKASDGRHPERMEFSSMEDDAERRDFTINAMYIPLTNADGPNSKVIDPHGGVHHLKSGEVRFVGNPKERLEEDQLRALRYARFASRFGNSSFKVPEDYIEAISEIKGLPAVSKERIRDEFIKGLEHPDVDPIKYIKIYKDLDLLDSVFPGMKFKLDTGKDYSDKKEKRLAVAWLLRDNDPEKVTEMLKKGTWTKEEVADIIYLLRMARWFAHYGKNMQEFLDMFHSMKHDLSYRSHLADSHIRQWSKMIGADENIVDQFLKHELSTKGYVKDMFGDQVVNPDIVKFLGKIPQGREFGDAIKHLETEKFRKGLPFEGQQPE